MKYYFPILFVLVMVPSLKAAPIVASGLGETSRLDTEVSTNVVFNLRRQDVKTLDVRLQFTGTSSNNVEVAFGRDGDGDGVLAPEETGMMLGWRAGRYFIEDVAGENRILEEAVGTNDVRSLQLEVKTGKEYRPKTFACTSDEGVRFLVLTEDVPGWTYDTRWNLVRVTRRGGDPTGEWCRIVSDYRSFFISIR